MLSPPSGTLFPPCGHFVALSYLSFTILAQVSPPPDSPPPVLVSQA